MIALAGIACGAVLFLVFRRFMDRAAVREWKRKRRAHVLGLYLFGDDPVNSLRSFAQIARANNMLLVHALPALAMAALVIAAAVFALDRYEARELLRTRDTAVVTVRWSRACEPNLEASPGMRPDSPAVHKPATEEVSWRVRLEEKWSGSPRAGCDGHLVETRIQSAAPPTQWLLWFSLIAWATSWLLSISGRLFRSLAQFLQTLPAFHRLRRNLT